MRIREGPQSKSLDLLIPHIQSQMPFFGEFRGGNRYLYIKTDSCLVELGSGNTIVYDLAPLSERQMRNIEYVDCEILTKPRGEKE